VAERVFERAHPVAVELVLDRPDRLAAGLGGALEDGVHVPT
jgi:hypothetical protein